jgi:hypothetical protein
VLEYGDLLVMGGATQKYWMHSVPTESNAKEPRINLTFRLAKLTVKQQQDDLKDGKMEKK